MPGNGNVGDLQVGTPLYGHLFPCEGMPVAAQYIAEVLPVTHFMRMIRGLVLRDAMLWELYRDVLWLAGFFVLGMIVTTLRFKKRLD